MEGIAMRRIVFAAVAGAALLLPAGMVNAQGDYPPCSRGMTDKCLQTHEGMGGAMEHHMMRHHMMRHHMMHHHMMHHRHHHMK
jgi:hypothetical protein